FCAEYLTKPSDRPRWVMPFNQNNTVAGSHPTGLNNPIIPAGEVSLFCSLDNHSRQLACGHWLGCPGSESCKWQLPTRMISPMQTVSSFTPVSVKLSPKTPAWNATASEGNSARLGAGSVIPGLFIPVGLASRHCKIDGKIDSRSIPAK